MDEPAFAGCVLKARIIGVIEVQQDGDEGKIRNDRIVAIEQDNHSFADIDDIRDLGKQFVRELEEFFVNCHALSGTKYKILGVRQIARGTKLVQKGRKEVFHSA